MSSFADAFKHELRSAKKERKSDEIVQFMRDNWRLFAPSRRQMDDICAELEQRGDLNPTGLSVALDLPECLLFKKIKIVDAARTLMQLKKSELYRTFTELPRVVQGRETCLLAVAGGRSLVITNMPTATCEGLVEIRIMDAGGRCLVSVIPIEDAPMRMPRVFGPKEQ